MLTYITGSVDEELLQRNECLVRENGILRSQIKGRIRLNVSAERRESKFLPVTSKWRQITR
jgi:hypothetical protein